MDFGVLILAAIIIVNLGMTIILSYQLWKKDTTDTTDVDRIKEVYAIVDPQTGCIRDSVYAEISLLKQKKEKETE